VREAAPAVRSALTEGSVPAALLPHGIGAAVLDEPGTDARYVVLWPSSFPGTADG
jgi:hypothetical protein